MRIYLSIILALISAQAFALNPSYGLVPVKASNECISQDQFEASYTTCFENGRCFVDFSVGCSNNAGGHPRGHRFSYPNCPDDFPSFYVDACYACPQGQELFNGQCLTTNECEENGEGATPIIDDSYQSCDVPNDTCEENEHYYLGSCVCPDGESCGSGSSSSESSSSQASSDVGGGSSSSQNDSSTSQQSSQSSDDQNSSQGDNSSGANSSGDGSGSSSGSGTSSGSDLDLSGVESRLDQVNENLEGIAEKLNEQGGELPTHSEVPGFNTFSDVNADFFNRVSSSPIAASFSNVANIIDFSNASCTVLGFDLPPPINTYVSTDIHCQIYSSIATVISGFMIVVFIFAAFRVLAGA